MSLILPDSGLIIWMTLIFGIVFFILAKFGFPAITGMVDERNRRISESIAKAREAEQSLSTLARQQAEMIEQTRLEQGRLLREASEDRDRIVAQAREQAKQQASAIIAEARARIAQERDDAIRDLRRQVAQLSVEVAEKIVRKELSSDSAQAELLDSLVDEASRTTLS